MCLTLLFQFLFHQPRESFYLPLGKRNRLSKYPSKFLSSPSPPLEIQLLNLNSQEFTYWAPGSSVTVILGHGKSSVCPCEGRKVRGKRESGNHQLGCTVSCQTYLRTWCLSFPNHFRLSAGGGLFFDLLSIVHLESST